MFSSEVITFFFISVFASIYLFQLLHKFRAISLAKIIVAFGCFSSIYCVLAGLFLAFGWQDPLSTASTEMVTRTSLSHGGRGGLLVAVIRYWPYVLIGLGIYTAYQNAQLLLGLIKKSRTNS